ncbi:Transglycosylase SLT domain-containing protein [Streptomyces zhaozhouensis]|uniref:Transglycosylase SLT domain-containing protein n=1 Tax=Streptomyces zhaozhouensis TaxID=1300267 RepID=A0A286E944_9ACTN|nr:bifunctional lytic transglycosylase/C40 family peptidase [Streptomyces zhaozhouensis]SOD67422.1 Transglycosylase SLT domain-containing protein [Streptomyces zhaozhouensis]
MAAVGAAGIMLASVGVVVGVGAVAASASGPPSSLGGVPQLPPEAAPFEPWLAQAAEQCDGLPAAVLAAQLWAESGFSLENPLVSPAGAEGPAQFMPGTWATWGRDDDGNGRVSPYDPGDAVMAQGRLMCSLLAQAHDSGLAGDPLALALAGYNAGWGAVQDHGGVPPYQETQEYIEKILAKASEWTVPPVSGNGAGTGAVQRAAAYLGTPYSWGGGTPSGPGYGFCDGVNGYTNGRCMASITKGFDCSSLVQMAWWPATQLPRVAADQYAATASTPVSRDQLQPGDLVFWTNGGTTGIYHVALYYGDGHVLHAPRTGRDVSVQPLDDAMPTADFYGATRPV